MTNMTVGQALEDGRNSLQPVSDTPALDVQRLLSDVLDQPRSWVLAHPEHSLTDDQLQWYQENISRLRRGVPLPYVLGWQEFYGRRFLVTEDVLIPRPDTECLVELALAILNDAGTPAVLVDAGTGSGCIAVTMAAERPQDRLIGVDISPGALQVAAHNAELHHVRDRMTFVKMDGLTGLRGQFDMVCANLPYIARGILQELPVAAHEPVTALDGGVDGFNIIRPALARLPALLKHGGCGLFEIAADQGDLALMEIGSILPGWQATIFPDLAGRDRVVKIERKVA